MPAVLGSYNKVACPLTRRTKRILRKNIGVVKYRGSRKQV